MERNWYKIGTSIFCIIACLLLWVFPPFAVIIFPLQCFAGPICVLSLKRGESAVLWWFIMMDLPEAFILIKFPFLWFFWLIYILMMHFVLDELGERQ